MIASEQIDKLVKRYKRLASKNNKAALAASQESHCAHFSGAAKAFSITAIQLMELSNKLKELCL